MFVPRIKNISVSLNKPTFEGGTRNYTFLCGFQHSVGNEYLYMVSWYQNGDEMSVSDYGEDENDDKLLLTESTFISHGFTLGNTVCNGTRGCPKIA